MKIATILAAVTSVAGLVGAAPTGKAEAGKAHPGYLTSLSDML